MSIYLTSSQVARAVPFDNLTNGFTSTNVQDAIEEVRNLLPDIGVSLLVDDFISGGPTGPSSTTTTFGLLGWGSTGNRGTGLCSYISAPVNHPGILQLSVISFQKNDIAEIDLSPFSITLGGTVNLTIRSLLRFPILSNATDTYLFRWGLQDDISSVQGAFLANGVFFEYSSALSTNFRVRTRKASTTTTTDSGVAVVANQFYQLKIKIVDGASAEFFIDGVSVATHTTNIPTAPTGPVYKMDKTNGNTNTRTCEIDFYDANLTVVR